MKRKIFIMLTCLLMAISVTACGKESEEEKKPVVEKQEEIKELEIVELQDAAVGKGIVFGSYEQDNDLSNGKEAIQWLVLAKEDNRILVISEEILICKPHMTERVKGTWETSEIRAWLNGEFLNDAFSEEEKAQIPVVTVVNNDNAAYGTKGGNDTNDALFLLSLEEANQYFESEKDRICSASVYAKENGECSSEDGENCFWWLRSSGYDEDRVMRVSGNGTIADVGERIDRVFIGVRPAMWIEY